MDLVVLDGYCLNPGDLSWEPLERLANTRIYDRTALEEVAGRAAEAEIVLTNKTPLPGDVLSQLPKLRYIGVLATGYDVVDVEAAGERGIVVTNVPTYGTDSVAQFAFALLLELCHRVALHDISVKEGEWSRCSEWSYWKTPLMELSGKTMAVIGFGRIGRQVGRLADAFGMTVIAHDAYEGAAPDYAGFRWVSLEEALREADVVSLHCPLTPETEGLINRNRLALMKPSSFLLNTSRGPLVVEQDLADALNDKTIAGAGLDVLTEEPPVSGSPLFEARNCILTPHIAWATREARSRLLATVVENVEAFLAGRPRNRVG